MVPYLFALSAAAQPAAAPALAPDRSTGIYRSGQTAAWTPPEPGLAYRIKDGGYTVVQQGVTTTLPIRASRSTPGWLLLEVDRKPLNGQPQRPLLGAALFDPSRIGPALPAPDSFRTFWAEKVRNLRAQPMQPVLTPKDSGDPAIDYHHITLNGWAGSKVRGQLARPKAGDKLPALLVVQWAGVYPLERGWATGQAKNGWLTLNISAHDQPIMEPPAFYAELNNGALRGYPAIGSDDKETSYFLRMYLSCVRAADYLASRPDWNGKVMVVTGGSQGGMQALAVGGLHERITGIVANVPAGCDNTGNEFGRAPGWPSWQWMSQGKDPKNTRETGRFFDVVNFAPMIKAPALIGVGGIDTVCPPPGVFAAFNAIRAVKEVVYMPAADHMRDHSAYYQRSGVWMDALKNGRRPPAGPALP